MEGDKEIRQALLEFIRKAFPEGMLFHAVVKSVDKNKRTCSVIAEGMREEMPGVLLQPNVNDNGDGIVPIPKVDSDVWCGLLNNDDNQVFVLMCTEVEEYIVNAKLTLFNKGNNGGLVIVGKAKDNFDAIKQWLSSLTSAIGAGFTAVGASTAANGPAGKTAFDTAINAVQLNYKDMENKDVKH